MSVHFHAERLLQPFRSPPRTAQNRYVEEYIVDAVRKLWAPRLPIGNIVDVINGGLWRRPNVVGEAGMSLTIRIVLSLGDSSGCASARIIGIIVVTTFADQNKLQTLLK